MFKVTAIALAIATSSATAVIPSDPLTLSGRTADSDAVQQVRPVYYESAHCRTAQRQIAMYIRALSRLDMAHESHRRVVPIYRQARQAERDWHDQNCRPLLQTARGNPHNDTL